MGSFHFGRIGVVSLCVISRLVAGQKIDDVIAHLNGIDCSGKGTSCPDQLCRALEQLKAQ